MIELTHLQRDALIEVCNVGMSKSAKQLSSLLNTHILITIPEINLYKAEDVYKDTMFLPEDTLSYVYQVISGDFHGRASLIFQQKNTSILTHAVIGNTPTLTKKEIRACEQEAILEIGNIIISSCMSAIVNMLSCNIELTIPKYCEDQIQHLISAQMNQISDSSDNIILIETRLETAGQNISGKLLLMMKKKSTEFLFSKLEKLLNVE